MSEKRHLTSGEIALLTEIFGERDYFRQTTIERGNWYMHPGFGMVSNNNIKVGRSAYSDDFSKSDPAWFVHEGVHLVQEQTFGRHLLLSKGAGKARSFFGNDYQYEDDVRKGIPFEKMSIEAQASMIADYYQAVKGKSGRYVSLPAEVYQSIIPESYVPSFGRSRKHISGQNSTFTSAKRPERERNSSDEEPVEGLFRRVPHPQPKPRLRELPAIPLSNKPLIPGAQKILPPSIELEGLETKRARKPAPEPRRKPTRNRTDLRTRSAVPTNPFDLGRPDLQLQAEMLDRNPMRARQMILAAGRDPELFGFS